MKKVPAKAAKDRTAWGDEFPACWLCGREEWQLVKPERLEIHEICRCAHSNDAWDRCNYFRACTECHAGPLDSKAQMPHALQLAIKFMRDRENFDLAKWLEVARKPHTYVTIEEIELCLKSIAFAETYK